MVVRGSSSISRFLFFLLVIIPIFSLSASSVSANEHDLDLNTLSPSNVNQTNATFRTNFTSMNNSLDAAFIYWNYTNKNSGKEVVGPSNLSYSADKMVEVSQYNLKSDVNYDITSYAVPVNWNNYSRVRNLLRLSNYSSTSNNIYNDEKILSKLNSTSEAFTALFGSEDAMKSIMDNKTSKFKLWLSTGEGAVTYRSDDILLDPQNYVETAGVETEQVINFTDVSQIKINFSAVISNNNDANTGDDYVALYLNNTEEKVWGDNTLSDLPVGIRTVDTSSIGGLKTIEFRAVRTSNGAGYETHDIEASLYDIYLNSSERGYLETKSIDGGTVELASREKPIICDLYSSESGCISNSKHVIDGENIFISEFFNSTKDSVIEAKSNSALIELNSSSLISGIWRGKFNITSKGNNPVILTSGAKLKPENGLIHID